MLFQGTDTGRLVLIYIVQLSFSCIFLYLAYKILSRNRNRLTLTLSGFYISEAIAFIFGAVYISFTVNPLVFILYFMAIYLITFGPIFLVIFLFNLLKIGFKLKKQLMIIIAYAISVLILLNYPGGLTINEETNWRPLYSWTLLFFLYILIIGFIIIPSVVLFSKLYKSFEDTELKKKLKYFLVGFLGVTLTFFGGVLYNTQTFALFNLVWNIALLFILIPSALLIYFAWGHGI